MNFFYKIGKKVSQTYDVTAEKTSRLAREAKFRMKINENKSDIKQLYKEIGKKVYEKHVREENIDIDKDLEEECTKIDVLSSEIETYLKSILELKEKKQCPKCHAEIDLDSVYCSRCGEKQPDVEAKQPEEIIEDLENSEIKPENQTEKEIVEQKLSGEDNTERKSASEIEIINDNKTES